MKIIGLTGGIATGKSAVASMLRRRGIPVIDADVLARDVVAVGTAGLAALVEAFGSEILDENGALDRKRLGQRIFRNDDDRRRLNQIVHPLVAARFMRDVSALDDEGHAVVVYEVPLLFENNLDAMMHATILVDVDEDCQRQRLAHREGLSPSEIEQRLRAQMAREEKRTRATVIVDNSGTLVDTATALALAWESVTGTPLPQAP